MGTWEWDFQRDEVSWSKNVGPLVGLGFPRNECTYQQFLSRIFEDDRPHFEEAIELTRKGRILFELDFRVVWPDGSTHWMSCRGRMLDDPNGKPARLAGIGVDIGARKRSEQRLIFLAKAGSELAQSLDDETTLANIARLIVPEIADWCFVERVDDDGTIRRHAVVHSDPAKAALATGVGRSDAFSPRSRYAQARVIRTGRAELYPTVTDEDLVDIARDSAHLEQLKSFGFRSAISAPMIARGRTLGVITLVTAESRRVYDIEDLELVENLASRIALAVDNARLYRASQDAIQMRLQANALLDTFADSAPVGLAFFGQDQQLIRINETLAALCGIARDEAVGLRADSPGSGLAQIIGPELGAVYESREPMPDVEVSMSSGTTPEQRRDFVVSYYPVRTDGDQFLGVGVVCLEITERKRGQLLLEETYRALERASNAKDRFLADLSHELRTPLTPVLAAVSAMLEDPETPDELGPTLEMTMRNIELEARLIDDLLDITRISQGKLQLAMEPVNAHVLLHRALEIATAGVPPGQLLVETDLRAAEPFVMADTARFQQVLWNLLKNALKFTPAGGALFIRSSNQPDPTPDDPERQAIVIEFRDTGIGIEPDVLPRIFDAFEQGGGSTTRRFGGLGLGLAISRGVMEAMHGSLSASSEGPGKGSTFSVRLSTVQAPKVGQRLAPKGRDKPEDAPPRPGIKILLVEDDPDTLTVMSNLLKRRGHEVAVADSIASAMATASGLDFDLLVSDLGLPDGTGIDLIRRLSLNRKVRAIALSGYGMESDVQRCLAAGFDSHLTKPVNFAAFEAEIRRVVGTTIQPQVAGAGSLS